MGMVTYYHNRKRIAPELEGGAIFVESLDDVSFAFNSLFLVAPFSRFSFSSAPLLELPIATSSPLLALRDGGTR